MSLKVLFFCVGVRNVRGPPFNSHAAGQENQDTIWHLRRLNDFLLTDDFYWEMCPRTENYIRENVYVAFFFFANFKRMNILLTFNTPHNASLSFHPLTPFPSCELCWHFYTALSPLSWQMPFLQDVGNSPKENSENVAFKEHFFSLPSTDVPETHHAELCHPSPLQM